MHLHILDQRAGTHGDFNSTAYLAQSLKAVVHRADNHPLLLPAQRESLDLICTKIARILAGDPNEVDHWLDIAGYAALGQNASENWGL